jgi:hypothetical protein
MACTCLELAVVSCQYLRHCSTLVAAISMVQVPWEHAKIVPGAAVSGLGLAGLNAPVGLPPVLHKHRTTVDRMRQSTRCVSSSWNRFRL